jgi:hypothetical protein
VRGCREEADVDASVTADAARFRTQPRTRV